MDPPETPADVLRGIGRRIAELRAAQGWTQEKMAEALDVNLPYLQRIEGGRENLTVRSLARLAHVLGVRVGALFEAPVDLTVRGPGRPRRPRATAAAPTDASPAVEGDPATAATRRPGK
ncbi:MAG: helix-turn-helix transcriptional regulator [Deltaproteobacteria bacterium]|nr:helix-turn-helix transcriptional regulator [Myxococcales bacterium]MDP3219589.1 helix-turn-helix transcriptional regulator [Deltaproteobacteria bacterium]